MSLSQEIIRRFIWQPSDLEEVVDETPAKAATALAVGDRFVWQLSDLHAAAEAQSGEPSRLPVAAWDESKHPRDPGGEGGGQWISVYHGTQTGFEGDFSTDKIGAGESGAAQGAGINLTTSVKTAKGYAKGGPVYKVEILARHEELLNFDVPFNEQSSYVKERLNKLSIFGEVPAIKKINETTFEAGSASRGQSRPYRLVDEGHRGWTLQIPAGDDYLPGKSFSTEAAGKKALQDLTGYVGNQSGRKIYESLGSPRHASRQLNDVGIHGAVYEAGQAGLTDPFATNYTIFDPSKVRITSRDARKQMEAPRSGGPFVGADADPLALEWDESKHPRVPGGSGDPSGEWTSGDSTGGDPDWKAALTKVKKEFPPVSELPEEAFGAKDSVPFMLPDGRFIYSPAIEHHTDYLAEVGIANTHDREDRYAVSQFSMKNGLIRMRGAVNYEFFGMPTDRQIRAIREVTKNAGVSEIYVDAITSDFIPVAQLRPWLDKQYAPRAAHEASDADLRVNALFATIMAAVNAATDRIFGAATMDSIRAALIDFGQRMVARFGRPEQEFDLATQSAIEYLRGYGAEHVAGIGDTTRKLLRDTLTEGLRNGEDQAALARRVKLYFRGVSAGRARVIAATESHNATQHGAFVGLLQAGVTAKQWISGEHVTSTPSRPTHRELHGQIRHIGDPFEIPSTGQTAMRPGNFGDPAQDCNCNCVIQPAGNYAPDNLAASVAVVADPEWPRRLAVHERRVLAAVRRGLAAQEAAVLAVLAGGQVPMVATWDESKHPRVPGGSGDPSGEWTSEGAGGTVARDFSKTVPASLHHLLEKYGPVALHDGSPSGSGDKGPEVAYYSFEKNAVYNLQGDRRSWVIQHEWGHYIDHQMGGWSATSQARMALKEDAQKLLKPGEYSNLIQTARARGMEGVFASYVQAATASKAGYGHPKSYYAEDHGRRGREMFANAIAMRSNPKVSELARQISPRWYAAFEEAVKS